MQKTFLLLFVFCIVVLFLRLFLFYSSREPLSDKKAIVFLTTITQAKQKAKHVYYTVVFAKHQVTLLTSSSEQFDFGTTVRVSGVIEAKTSLDSDRTWYLMQFPKIEKVSDAQFLTRLANTSRKQITDTFQQTLPPVSASLLTGIVFGEKASMPKNFEDALANTGVLHVIAASGMNVSLVAGGVLWLSSLFFKRQLAVGVAIASIAFYAILAGLQPSIVRAALMGSIAFAATLLGRQYTALFALFFTGFFMLLFDPILLLDLGFQLSFLATTGIVLIQPLVSHQKQTNGVKKVLQADLAITFSAQVATVPLLLSAFSSYGLLSLLTNVLVLWTVPIILLGGMIAGVVSLIVPFLASFLLYLIYPLLLLFELVVNIFGSFPILVNIEELPWQITVGYYCVLLAVILAKQKRFTS